MTNPDIELLKHFFSRPLSISFDPTRRIAGGEDAMSTYPDNSSWTGNCSGFDRQADGEDYDMPIVFTHTDGRVLTMDINTSIGGEVIDSAGERIPGTEDAFVSMVDEAYADYFTTDGPVLPEPSDLTRRFWIYDTSVSYGAGLDKNRLAFQSELEESDTFVVDLDYDGSWADMPQKAVTDVLTRQARAFIALTMTHTDLEEIYTKIIFEMRSGGVERSTR